MGLEHDVKDLIETTLEQPGELFPGWRITEDRGPQGMILKPEQNLRKASAKVTGNMLGVSDGISEGQWRRFELVPQDENNMVIIRQLQAYEPGGTPKDQWFSHILSAYYHPHAQDLRSLEITELGYTPGIHPRGTFPLPFNEPFHEGTIYPMLPGDHTDMITMRTPVGASDRITSVHIASKDVTFWKLFLGRCKTYQEVDFVPLPHKINLECIMAGENRTGE